MTLEQYLEDREIWQDKTIEKIRDKIIYQPRNVIKSRFGEKLVAIYGPPQIGKTTLILYLLGIKPKKQKDVYDTLRADVPKGNSSTSTAIIYQKSDNYHYGIKYGNGTSIMEYCTKEKLKETIREIRGKVENDEASQDILHIYIPRDYFDENSLYTEGISIVDLPGDGSRNLKEKTHVDAIISKYMAIATLNIITSKANEINSLGEMSLPISVDWRNLPNKYIVVITSAFGQGTIKSYFSPNNKREKTFLEFVIDEYSKNMNSILNPVAGIEFFPIDIGDSLYQLTEKNGFIEKDSEEIINASKVMAERIRHSIQTRQGNSLKRTLMDFKAFSSEYAKDKLSVLEQKIEELEKEIENINDEITKKKIMIQQAECMLKKLRDKHTNFLRLNNTKIYLNSLKHFEKIRIAIGEMASNGKIKDREKKILDLLQEEMLSFISLTYCEYDLDNSPEKLNAKYYDIVSRISLEEELEKKYFSGGLFQKKIKETEILSSISELISFFGNQLDGDINEIIKSEKQKEKRAEYDYVRAQQLIIESERSIEKDEEKLKKDKSALSQLHMDYEFVELQREKDKKTIDDYLKTAEKEYLNYRDEQLKMLESEQYSVEEKVYILIYLCLIEKDYQSIYEMR